MNEMTINKEQRYKPLIIIFSVLLPCIVTALYFIPKFETDIPKHFLPMINAIINGTTFIVLIFALVAVKNRNIALHRKLTTTAMILSILFLGSYVTNYLTNESTPFGGEGFIRIIYFFILITHIILATIVVPLVLFTYVRAIAEKFDKHRKIAKITYPIWLYVTLTGVLVFLMIYPYY